MSRSIIRRGVTYLYQSVKSGIVSIPGAEKKLMRFDISVLHKSLVTTRQV